MKQTLSVRVDQEEERSQRTKDALADVDAHRVIDHQSVHAWADALNINTPLPGGKDIAANKPGPIQDAADLA